MTMSSTSWVGSPSKLSMAESGASSARGDVEPIVEAAVDLQLGDRAQPEAHAERREPQQVPFQPGRRIEDIVLLVEAAFDQHQSRANGFGIFGHERALLRSRTRRVRKHGRDPRPSPAASYSFASNTSAGNTDSQPADGQRHRAAGQRRLGQLGQRVEPFVQQVPCSRRCRARGSSSSSRPGARLRAARSAA